MGLNNKVRCVLLLAVMVSLSAARGAEETKQLQPQGRAEDYKIGNRNAISQIVDGKYDDAIKYFEGYLDEHPRDLESLYGLAMAYTQKREINRAMDYVRQAVDAGLPFERFLAGPRDLLRPLTDSVEFKEFSQKHPVELLHGPMVGCVTDRSAKIRVRTANEVPVQVLVSESEKMDQAAESEIVKTDKGKDFTAVIALNGLKPDRLYYYELVVNNKKEPKRWSFRTFPLQGAKSKFQVGFGGGAGYTPWHERMWNTIGLHNLTAFLFLGDNVYIDHPEQTEVQQYCYYRRQSRPEFRGFTAATCIYAIWDDHDFADNDSIGGPDVNKPEWKRSVWHTFRNNWNNPYYGGGESQPGCWFNFSIGDVDFFMLDGRYYRTEPNSENASILGPVQKKWLLEKLKSSKATFKVIASPVVWSYGAKGGIQITQRGMVAGSVDTWEGFKGEREEIFSFIEQNNIDGVILLSADRHRSEAWKIDRPNGYPFYEFESSKLTNIHTHDLVTGALFGYNERCSFGLLSFDTTTADPQVTYQIINIDNEIIHTLSLKRSQLAKDKYGGK